MQHEFHLTLEFSCGPCQSVIYSRFPSQNAIHGDLWELTIRSEEDFTDQSIISNQILTSQRFNKLKNLLCWVLSLFSYSLV